MLELVKLMKKKFKDFDITSQHLGKVIRDNNITRKRTRHKHYPSTKFGKPTDEKKELKETIKDLTAILKSRAKQNQILIEELDAITDKFGDERRTNIDFAGGVKEAVEASKTYLAEKNLDLKIEVEVRDTKELDEVLAIDGVDRVMLDNFSPEQIKESLKTINGKLEVEASGGINASNLKSYAETGVDFISMGALTHSVKSLDLSMLAEFN